MFRKLAQIGVAMLMLAGISASAQASIGWMKAYASGCPSYKRPCPANRHGRAGQLLGDARFQPLMHRSFPQIEHWWATRQRPSERVSEMTTEFLAHPFDVSLTDNRYLTINGCVPRDCTDGGMLWADTGAHPAVLIFVGTNDVHTVNGKSLTHLEIYASQKLNFEKLPPAFLESLQRWWAPYTTRKYFPSQAVLATLVQPSGLSQDLTWNTVFYQKSFTWNKKTGVTQ